MILDEPDEDADELEDDKLLEAFVAPAPSHGAGAAAPLPDWPVSRSETDGIGIHLDCATVAWFRANHADWQREIGSVLRGWIVAQALGQPHATPLDSASLPQH